MTADHDSSMESRPSVLPTFDRWNTKLTQIYDSPTKEPSINHGYTLRESVGNCCQASCAGSGRSLAKHDNNAPAPYRPLPKESLDHPTAFIALPGQRMPAAIRLVTELDWRPEYLRNSSEIPEYWLYVAEPFLRGDKNRSSCIRLKPLVKKPGQEAQESNILPGFKTPLGSKTFFTARMQAISAGSREASRNGFFNKPTPCSAEMLPP